MIRTQVYLPEEMHRELMLMAKARRTNFSSLIREGVKEITKKTQKKSDTWKEFIGAGGKGGSKNLASRIDYYLYGGGSKWAKRK